MAQITPLALIRIVLGTPFLLLACAAVGIWRLVIGDNVFHTYMKPQVREYLEGVNKDA